MILGFNARFSYSRIGPCVEKYDGSPHIAAAIGCHERDALLNGAG